MVMSYQWVFLLLALSVVLSEVLSKLVQKAAKCNILYAWEREREREREGEKMKLKQKQKGRWKLTTVEWRENSWSRNPLYVCAHSSNTYKYNTPVLNTLIFVILLGLHLNQCASWWVHEVGSADFQDTMGESHYFSNSTLWMRPSPLPLFLPFEDDFQHIILSQNVGGCWQDLQHWQNQNHTAKKKKKRVGEQKKKKKKCTWSMWVSNSRPSRYQHDALPTELMDQLIVLPLTSCFIVLRPPHYIPMNIHTLTLDNKSGRVTMKCVLSVSVAVSMAFFSLFDNSCSQS